MLWREWSSASLHSITHSKQSTNIRPIQLETILFNPHIRALFIVSSFYIWVLFMTRIPHKEERFMFVIYPHLCISAALTLSTFLSLIDSFFAKRGTRAKVIFIVAAFCFVLCERCSCEYR
jgi:hypothetical protein